MAKPANLFSEEPPNRLPKPVTCLGKTFASEAERRAYFTVELRSKLQDADFRAIEGFPIGTDEAILALSDPPYYTACPNPWLQDFIAEWESQKDASLPVPYHREPFAADVKEGKNDPIYNAHSYHTKVPHKAIMRYILHYTEPEDIVFDGFCGTGMTGVAAQLCGDKAEVESLGYLVQDDGTILQKNTDEEGSETWQPFSRLGARKAVLNDLSPAATFIAYNYNTPVDIAAFEKEAQRILAEVEAECGWMYETLHSDGTTKGTINYTVWSDVFVCPSCSNEIIYWEAAVDAEAARVLDEFPCPQCNATLTKRHMDRAWATKFDGVIGQSIRQAKQIPVLINYTANGKRYEKKPDGEDLALIAKIDDMEIPFWFPADRMMEGGETRRNDPTGITHIHHFYTKRNLWILASLYDKAFKSKYKLTVFFVQYAALGFSKIARYVPTHFSQVNQYLSGTLYIGSQQVEVSSTYILTGKLKRLVLREAQKFSKYILALIGCTDSSALQIANESFDYIFLDPPFGSNLNYSELNLIWESWLRVITNNKQEAIENKVQKKAKNEYRQLMTECFQEAYRVLKPGHWMTVEFSNTKTSIWNIIQTALSDAGFIVANVAALDKKQGSFKAVTTATAVKQDLIISAYKPNGGFEQRFIEKAGSEDGVWEFIATHLGYLPVVKMQGKVVQPVDERQGRLLFDAVVAFYVRKGKDIPIASSQAFQAKLAQRFDERDGMYFLHEQALEYDKKKALSSGLQQQDLFVQNEETAIQWLRALLGKTPQKIQDIQPLYMQKLTGFDKQEEQLELRTILEQNFIIDDSGNWHIPDSENAAHVATIRERALLKEFDAYKQAPKRLRIFRIEAVRAGFKKAYTDHNYEAIIATEKKLPAEALEGDPILLMYYTSALTRLGRD